MGDRCNEDVIRLHAIQHGVWKAIQDETALASHTPRPPKWRFSDAVDRVIDLKAKRCAAISLRA